MGTASKTGGAALALVATALAPAAGTETAGASVTAKVVKPSEVSAAVATEWMTGGSPGVFTLRIPGAATGTIALTVSTVEGGGGTVAFAASSEYVGAMQQLIAQIAASQLSPLSTYQASGIATSGTLNGEGVQVIVMKANQNGDDSGTVVAIITFD